MPFGKVLKRLRTQNNLTQKQLADVLGISESTVGMYERGHREPAFEMLEAIADYFNVDMDYLTGRTEVERKYTFSPPAPLPDNIIPMPKSLVHNINPQNCADFFVPLQRENSGNGH